MPIEPAVLRREAVDPPAPVSGELSTARSDPAAGANTELVSTQQLRLGAALLLVAYQGLHAFSGAPRSLAVPASDTGIAAPDPLSALFVEGHTAVALLVVLSGFTLALCAGGKPVHWRAFIAAHLLRTYPPFLFVLLLGTAIHASSLSWLPLLQTCLGGANLSGAQQLGSFSEMFWVVALLWQCQLLFPALMSILSRTGAGQLGLLAASIMGARILGYLQGLDPVHALYPHLLGRLDQFMLGMVAGHLYFRQPDRRLWCDLLAPALGVLLLGALAFNRLVGWANPHWVRLFTPTLEGLVWAAFVLGYVAVIERSGAKNGSFSRLLGALSAGAYGLCLWHPVFIELQQRHGWVPAWLAQPEPNAALVLSVTTLPLLLAFCLLSHHTLEKPLFARPAPARGRGPARRSLSGEP
jgi:peptidoglycan/LPS O-acetylase OafA/YrhL